MQMKPARFFFAVLILLFLAATPQAGSIRYQMGERADKIKAMKKHGLVYEKDNGFLGLKTKNSAAADLVAEENKARKRRYQIIAKEKCAEKWPNNRKMQQQCMKSLMKGN